MVSRRRRSRRAVGLLLGTAVLALVGVAHLAANVVPPTLAGTTEVPITVGTALVVEDAVVVDGVDGGVPQLGPLASRLLSDGAPVEGAQITFEVAGVPVCTAETRPDGVAVCAAGVLVPAQPVPSVYTARYAGDRIFQPAAATGPLNRLVEESPPRG